MISQEGAIIYHNINVTDSRIFRIKKERKMERKRVSNKIWLASPRIHQEEAEYAKEAFISNWMSTIGENLNQLESGICKYLGCDASVALSSGTAALHLAVKLADVQEGDIVLCSDMTFAATVNPVTYEKGIQVFIDSERETWNMNPEALEVALKKYEGRVKAVIVVNLYGTPSKLEEISMLCEKYGVVMIEDAAESLAATYKGKQTGTFGKYSAISFNGNKIITGTSGGMLLSDDVEAIIHARKWSTQSRDNAPWYQHTELGYNYRMSNVLAGIVRGQLLHLDEHKDAKKAIYKKYKRAFQDLPVKMNPYLECSEPNFWLSCFTISEDLVKSGEVTPEKVRLTLEAYNVESRPIWKPMHMQPYYKDRDFIMINNDNVGEDIFARGLCLPSDINMTEEQQDIVIDIIRSCF